jgi:hypothetical protein
LTPWQLSAISPTHFDSTFSRESRESTCTKHQRLVGKGGRRSANDDIH